MTSEQKAALREAAERVVNARFEYDRSSRDWPGTHYEREMKDELLTARAVWAEPAHPAAVLALLDECERMREALREIDRLGTLVAHDLQGRVEAGKVMAVQRMADNARAALRDGA
jgi:hypothetical protein